MISFLADLLGGKLGPSGKARVKGKSSLGEQRQNRLSLRDTRYWAGIVTCSVVLSS